QAPLFLLLAAGLCGCSGKPADVNGKVTAAGKDVTAGTIVLSPVAVEGNDFPGKPGLADIRPDGTYSMVVEAGANRLPHRYTVRFTPPPVHGTDYNKPVVAPYQGLTPK